MYAFFVDLQVWLAEWVETYNSALSIILIVFFILLPTIYLRIKFRAEFSKVSMFQPNIELMESSIIFVDNHRAAVYSYAAVLGLLLGLLYQEGPTSVYALLFIPAFSLVMLGRCFLVFDTNDISLSSIKRNRLRRVFPICPIPIKWQKPGNCNV